MTDEAGEDVRAAVPAAVRFPDDHKDVLILWLTELRKRAGRYFGSG